VAAVVVRANRDLAAAPPSPLIALLSLVGIVVAGYLAATEVGGTEAACGPIGDCNAVAQSEFSRLLGILPVSVAGVGGYLAILAAWVLARRPTPGPARPARLALIGLAVGGTLASAWLTFLEPFVIGAVCAWCLTSAVVMTLVLVVAVRSMGEPRVAALPSSPPPTAP
jgi:uncharacterized membrane protein